MTITNGGSGYTAPTVTRETGALAVQGSASSLVPLKLPLGTGGVLTYQWQKDGVDLPGRTASRLDLGTVTAADAGYYRCIIRYKSYTETSLAAELRVQTGAGPLPPPPLVFTPFQTGAAGLTIPAWPAGFVLQRTASLAVVNWHTVATTPPYTVPLVNAAEYFRLVPAP